ncbi:MAG: alpha-1,2-fucosyltransferase [Planctomycetaceae bacterium]
MIIVRLSGGLGNQLFQFATGRALSIRHQQPLVIDDRVFHEDRFRQFGMSLFRAKFQLPVESTDVQNILPPSRKRWAAFLKWRLTHGRRLIYLREKSLAFDSTVLNTGPNSYLHGYWQSEQYFADVAEEIRRELTLRIDPGGENPACLAQIRSGVSVSIHVRRGDYVSDPKASRVHGTCSVQYYRNAAQEIAGRISDPLTFYVFSDDPEWTKQNLNLPFATRYVCHNDDAHNYEDLRLMSACDHHIVANSSFSWWGAWLGQNPNRLVIAPKVWFIDPSRSDASLVPASWLRI